MPATILIVDDEKNTREGLGLALEEEYEVYMASGADEAFNLMEAETFDVILTDLRMAGKSGLKVIDRAITLPNRPICIMMTAYGNVETAVESMRRGAFDFLTKPVSLEKLEILIKRALQSRRIEAENVVLHERLDKKYSFDGIVGNSPGLSDVLDKVKLVAPSKATVLLEGETGTGKELIAQAIHQNSNRSRQAFVPVHCAALAANLLESELFGHEKGAYTGATERRVGRFESADGGTLFLDEIGEIDASTQVKLLRFLETRSFERLGSSKPVKVDVRLVCATNRNLSEMARRGEFREDLLYRLNVVTIILPPLRERPEDLPVLLNHYINYFAVENELPSIQLSEGAVKVLCDYRWPGNIRELRNFCENTVVLKRGNEVTEYDLDPKYQNVKETAADPQPLFSSPTLSREENEKRLLRNALIKANGNRTHAAELMGISRRTLHRKLIQWPELDVQN
ncbi:MAG: sigma-54-dependent Fis family transcriptional regulator [Puniceicoccaceae bacterium]|jgi:two-component system, NtrC family, response regulator AtoC|nr:sigma-54-dependent Fis family transcriptional regulator [Puniceicoccaceae bacterium]MBL6838126.1 sigma-54-dependent Fis family transcriptional regulator [Puniceicoccaceae bacterium]MBL6912806.1 sigma-54-dependent Fis family transcriptional regulator [Puniceicoccaceae bacterium]